MKIPGLSSFLGLALGERSILAAEVHVAGDRRQVRRSGEFVFPAELSWNRPEALGEALRQFLRQHRFSASRAVAGVPARWMMAREREVPPSSAEVGVSALRLQAERLFPPELKELVFDFAGETDTKQARRVLLVALPKQKLDQVAAVADSAGLTLLAVTSSTLALAAAGGRAGGSDLMLSVGAEAAEFAAMSHGTPHALRHLPVPAMGGMVSATSAAARAAEGGDAGEDAPAASVAPASNGAAKLGTELRRIVSVMPLNGHTRDLLLWDGVGLHETESQAIAGRIGLPVTRGDALKAMRATAEAGVEGLTARFGPAVALGIAAGVAAGKVKAAERLRALPVDFLHARLAPPKAKRIGRREVWGGVVVATLVAVFGFLLYDVHRLEGDVEAIQAERKQLGPDVKAAQAIKDRILLTHGWFMDGRPKVLDALRELTLAFPDSDPIWVTSFSVQEIRDTERKGGKVVPRVRWKCTLQGKASSLDPALTVRSRLVNNPNFTDVTLTRSQGGLSAAQGPSRSPFGGGQGGSAGGSSGGSSSSSSGSNGGDRDRGSSDRGGSDRGGSGRGAREPEVSFVLTFFYGAM